jgi:hypothetical protein
MAMAYTQHKNVVVRLNTAASAENDTTAAESPQTASIS